MSVQPVRIDSGFTRLVGNTDASLAGFAAKLSLLNGIISFSIGTLIANLMNEIAAVIANGIIIPIILFTFEGIDPVNR